MRAFNIFLVVIANENSFNLKLLGEVVGESEFDDVLIEDGNEGRT